MPIIMMCMGVPQVAAQQHCSTVTMSDTANNAVFELVGHNMDRISERRRTSERLMDKQVFKLEPGHHTMTFYRWDKSKLRGVLRNPQFYRDIKVEPVTVSIDVEPNMHYEIINEIVDEKSKLLISSSKFQECLETDKKLLAAKPAVGVANVILPELLQYRLDLLMEELKRTNQAQHNVIPTNVVSYFGAIVKAMSKNKLVILAVSPYSVADRLGLKTGDEITHLGGKSIVDFEGNESPLSSYLQELRDGSEMEVVVNRSGTNLTLSHQFDVKVVPEVQYSFVEKNKEKQLVNSTNLSPELDSKLDKLLIEISDLPQLKQRNNLTQLRISRSKSYDKKYGIVGELTTNKTGFTVHKVKENSAAFNVGLRANDIITNVNGMEIKSLSIAQMSQVIAALKAGEDYSLEIERGDKKLDLTGQLQPLEIPAYQVVIDTKSIDKAKNILAGMTYQSPVRRVDRVHSGEIIGFYLDPWAPDLSSLSNRGADLSGIEALNSSGARASSTSSSNSSSVSSSSSSAKPSGTSNPNN